MTPLVLIRHGQTDWNVEGRWQGQADPPLNERGREQAYHAAEYHKQFGFNALYSSDLSRAMETAQIIGQEMGLAVIAEPRLREINLGQWQGMLSADIQAQYPDEFRRWHKQPLSAQPPGGETILVLSARVLAAVNEIIARHPKQRIGMVSHEFPIAIVLCRSAGLRLDHLRSTIPQNGAWNEVVLQGELKWAD
jgi:broad specificity phosphatase PhoE